MPIKNVMSPAKVEMEAEQIKLNVISNLCKSVSKRLIASYEWLKKGESLTLGLKNITKQDYDERTTITRELADEVVEAFKKEKWTVDCKNDGLEKEGEYFIRFSMEGKTK